MCRRTIWYFFLETLYSFFGKLEQYVRASTENDSVVSLKVHSICAEERSNFLSDRQNLSFSLDPNEFFSQFGLKKFGTDLKSAKYVWKGTTWFFFQKNCFFYHVLRAGNFQTPNEILAQKSAFVIFGVQKSFCFFFPRDIGFFWTVSLIIRALFELR